MRVPAMRILRTELHTATAGRFGQHQPRTGDQRGLRGIAAVLVVSGRLR